MVALVIVLVVRTFVFTMVRVEGPSMQDTLFTGDRVAATIFDIWLNGPARGDVVVCTYPGADHMCIKRVIGMPGETLEIRGGVTYIDGEPLYEPYVVHSKDQNFGPIQIAEDHYFVMGDNRQNSTDSRTARVGALEKSAIHAKARSIVWPPDHFGGIE